MSLFRANDSTVLVGRIEIVISLVSNHPKKLGSVQSNVMQTYKKMTEELESAAFS